MDQKFTWYNSSKDFTTLDAWRKARLVQLFVYNDIIPRLPGEEKYNLGSQLRRASISATANISEGYGRFHYKEGMQFYRIARVSLYEVKDLLRACFDLRFIEKESFEKGVDLIEQAKVTLNGFIKFVESKIRT